MTRQIFLLFGALMSGLIIGVFLGGPFFQKDSQLTFEKDSEAISVNSENPGVINNDNAFESLQRRQSQEARKRYRLQERVEKLEGQFAKLEEMVEAGVVKEHDEPLTADSGVKIQEKLQEKEPEDKKLDKEARLVAAGLDPERAHYIMRFLGEIEMEKLYLHDNATREGWKGNMRYRQEINALREREKNIRQDLGEADYDRYLFGSGQSNRVVTESIIESSPAQEAGLQTGDIILSYAEERLFHINDIRRLSSQGTAGELVPVEVERNGNVLEFYLPRGPLGVRLSSDSLQP